MQQVSDRHRWARQTDWAVLRDRQCWSRSVNHQQSNAMSCMHGQVHQEMDLDSSGYIEPDELLILGQARRDLGQVLLKQSVCG